MSSPPRCTTLRLFAFLTLLAASVSLHAQSASTYSVSALSPLSGDTRAWAGSLTSAGTVFGESITGNTATAVYWSGSGTPTALDSSAGSWVYAQNANTTGSVIIGISLTDDSASALAWRQTDSGYSSAYSLPSLVGAWTYAYGVNASGTIVGESADNTSSSAIVWTWNSSSSSYTGSALASGSYAWNGATAINSSGTIVGHSYYYDETTSSDKSQALVWSLSGSTYGTPTVLATLGGANAYASDINDSSQIVGYSTNSSDVYRATLWTLNAETNTYTATDLGGLSATGASYAYAINSYGVAVGSAEISTGVWHATYYYNGAVYDLNDLVTLSSEYAGYYLSYATDINDAGQILAQLSDGTTYVLLTITAVPEPATCAALLGLGALGLVACRRRRTAA